MRVGFPKCPVKGEKELLVCHHFLFLELATYILSLQMRKLRLEEFEELASSFITLALSVTNSTLIPLSMSLSASLPVPPSPKGTLCP